MSAATPPETSLIADIWASFLAMPLWVKIWVFAILVPVNMAGMAFISAPMGGWIAFLALIALVANTPVMIVERGLTKTMALPHLPPWTALVLWIMFARPPATGAYDAYLTVLMLVNLVSLAFDWPDALSWLRERQRAKNRP
jgi:hypothetical protein